MIEDSPNIPDEIKSIVKAICKAYVRLTNGLIGLEHIRNICEAKFIAVDVNDESFTGSNKILGTTITDYDENCKVSHIMYYVNDPEYMKLIMILTHELGHVMTEPAPCGILKNGIYPVIKKTNAVYINCRHEEDGSLSSTGGYGFRTSDGFLEHMGSIIFEDEDFINELADNGYLVGGCTYKDERLFPSRIYDEYKACFELFDYLFGGELFTFSCKTYSNNQEIIDFVNRTKYFTISKFLDESNDALWALKGYEGKPGDSEFEKAFVNYDQKKRKVLLLADLLYEQMDLSLKDDAKYQELKRTYAECIYKNILLPLDSRGQDGSSRVREG